MNLERRKGDNDNNKLHAIGYTGADSRRCGLSNSRHDYAPAIDHSLMKRSSDTFAEFLPRSSIIHLSHALDSSIFHRGHPASMHHTVHDYINPVITGRIRESVRTNINLHPNNAPVNRDNDPSISVIYLFIYFFFSSEIFFNSFPVQFDSIVFPFDARFDGIWFFLNCF